MARWIRASGPSTSRGSSSLGVHGERQDPDHRESHEAQARTHRLTRPSSEGHETSSAKRTPMVRMARRAQHGPICAFVMFEDVVRVNDATGRQKPRGLLRGRAGFSAPRCTRAARQERDAGGAMKAVVYERYGPPQVLHAADVAAPVPGCRDVVVRVRATTVSKADIRCRSVHARRYITSPGRTSHATSESSGTVRPAASGRSRCSSRSTSVRT